MTHRTQTLLIAYSAGMSTLLAAVVLTGAVAAPKKQSFDEIRVHRLDLVEPNGTLRMVIANSALMPGVIVKGVEQPKVDRPQAGMIFYNDEGSENGGLIFGGHKDAHGDVVDSGGSLSFDRYGASEVVRLIGVDDKTDRFAGLSVSDREQRIWMGRTDDGAARVTLNDLQGHKRLVLEVASDGAPSLTFFNAQGKALQKLVPAP